MIKHYCFLSLLIISGLTMAARNAQQEFASAIRRNNINDIMNLVKKYPTVINLTKYKSNPLAYAVAEGNTQLAQFLIDKGWKPETFIDDWNTSIRGYLLNNKDLPAYKDNLQLYQNMINILMGHQPVIH